MNVFPDKNEVVTELVTKTPMFIEKLDYPNLRARGVRTMREYIIKYENSILPLSEKEKNWIADIISKTRDTCGKNGLGHLLRVPWRIAKSHDGLENSMPHTIGSVIVLPEHVFRYYSANDMALLLVHEATHLHQRAYPDFNSNAITRLGFKPVRTAKDHREVLRANPDTNNMIYALGRLEVNPVLDIDAENLSEYTLSPFCKYPSFEKIRNPEHPFEIIAELNAILYSYSV